MQGAEPLQFRHDDHRPWHELREQQQEPKRPATAEPEAGQQVRPRDGEDHRYHHRHADTSKECTIHDARGWSLKSEVIALKRETLKKQRRRVAKRVVLGLEAPHHHPIDGEQGDDAHAMIPT